MAASSVTRRMPTRADYRNWAYWKVPALPRSYIAVVVVAAVCFTCYAASQTVWHTSDSVKYALLLGGAMISVAAAPRVAYLMGGMTRDFITVWVLPIAILLPPVYAMLAPIPLYMLTQWLVHKGMVHRRVFTVASIGLTYGGVSELFRLFPAGFAGSAIGGGRHAFTWAIAVAVCEIAGGRTHNSMIAMAVKLSDPTVRISEMEFNREALQGDFAEFDLGVLNTVVVAVSPVLAVFTVPTVLLIRRFVMHAQLLAQTRIDTKTGLLNSSTWETEAATEVERARRTGSPLSVALIDIDHFKAVNDTHGHLVGDTVLRAVTDAIREDLRSYDIAGRFGGEEFVVLLPQARESDAISIAERLRTRVAAMAIPIAEDKPGEHVRLTISVGVASLTEHTSELTDLMAAADAAMYIAKQSGRNRTHAMGAPEGAIVAGHLGAAEAPGVAPSAASPAVLAVHSG